MNLQTFVFVIFANAFLTTISSIAIKFLKDRILILSIVVMLTYAVFALFMQYIWDFNLYYFFLLYIAPSVLITTLIFLIGKSINKSKIVSLYPFEYDTNRGKLVLNNIFMGFLGLGGAGAGKTKSLTKPTIVNMAKHNFTGIIYDYKMFDLCKCAFTQYSKHRSDVNLRFVNFFDIRYSNSINPIHPDMLLNQAYAELAAKTLMDNLANVDSSRDPYFIPTATAGLAGTIWRLKEDYPKYCTLPHAIAILTCIEEYDRIAGFLRRNQISNIIGSSFIKAAASDKTAASVSSTLSNYIKHLALPEIFYILSENDFKTLQLNDPSRPTLLCLSNDPSLDKVYSPILAMITSLCLQHMKNPGRRPAGLLLDEGMTMRFDNFQNIPAVAREYQIATMLLTQDLSQIDKVYDEKSKTILTSNLSNQFFGLTNNIKAAKDYSELYGKIKEKQYSQTQRSFETGGSQTTSQRETYRFPPETFLDLKSGEFMGRFNNANKNKLKLGLKMYNEPEEMIPMIKPYINERDIKARFNKIIQDAQDIIANDEAFTKGFPNAKNANFEENNQL